MIKVISRAKVNLSNSTQNGIEIPKEYADYTEAQQDLERINNLDDLGFSKSMPVRELSETKDPTNNKNSNGETQKVIEETIAKCFAQRKEDNEIQGKLDTVLRKLEESEAQLNKSEILPNISDLQKKTYLTTREATTLFPLNESQRRRLIDEERVSSVDLSAIDRSNQKAKTVIETTGLLDLFETYTKKAKTPISRRTTIKEIDLDRKPKG